MTSAEASALPGHVEATARLGVDFSYSALASSTWWTTFIAQEGPTYLQWDFFGIGYTQGGINIFSVPPGFGNPVSSIFPLTPNGAKDSLLIGLTPGKEYVLWVDTDALNYGDQDLPYLNFSHSALNLTASSCGNEGDSRLFFSWVAGFDDYSVYAWVECASPWGYRFQWVPSGASKDDLPRKWIAGCFYPLGDNFYYKGPDQEFVQINVGGILSGDSTVDDQLQTDVHIFDPSKGEMGEMRKLRTTYGLVKADMAAGRIPDGVELWRGPPQEEPGTFSCVPQCQQQPTQIHDIESDPLAEGGLLTVDWPAAPRFQGRSGDEWRYTLEVGDIGSYITTESSIEIRADGIVGGFVEGDAELAENGAWVVGSIESGRAVFEATVEGPLVGSVSGFGLVGAEKSVTGAGSFLSSGGLLGAEGGVSGPLAPRTLAVSLVGSGSGLVTSVPGGLQCAPVCAADFNIGAEVKLRASAGETSRFEGMTGDDDCRDRLVTLMTDRVCEANFIACSEPKTVLLSDVEVAGEATYEACEYLVVGPGVLVLDGGALELRAGRGIELKEGTSVRRWGSLSVVVDHTAGI